MVFKDIDLTFNNVYNGLSVLEGDNAVIQLVNDAVKTRLGEVLYDPTIGSATLDYAQGTRNSMSLNFLRDEIYFALLNETEIKCYKKNILVSLNDKDKSFVVRIAFSIKSEDRTITTNVIFNFNK
jgi:hypothetical protein